jgi:hypothetical protein
MSNLKVSSSSLLQGKLAGVRSKQNSVATGTGFAWMVFALLLLLGGGMFLDGVLNLAKGVRTILLFGYVVVLGCICYRHIITHFSDQPDDEEVALAVEEKLAEADGGEAFRSRLIAATQLSGVELNNDTSKAFVQVLMDQTESMAQSRDFKAIVPTQEFAKAGMLAVIVATIFGMVFVQNNAHGHMTNRLKRAFLSSEELLRDTTINSINVFDANATQADSNATLKTDNFMRGDDLSVEVVVTKNIDEDHEDEIQINVRYVNAERDIRKMAKRMTDLEVAQSVSVQTGQTRGIKDFAMYRISVPSVREPFELKVRADDASGDHDVKVVPSPTLREVLFDQAYPEYTGITSRTKRTRGELTLLKGSTLHAEVQSKQEIKAVYVDLFYRQPTSGDDANGTEANQTRRASKRVEIDPGSFRVKVEKSDSGKDEKITYANAAIPVDDEDIIGFRFHLTDKYNNESDDNTEPIYQVTVLKDKAPEVEILRPVSPDQKVTQRARIPLQIRVKDDYGVKKLKLFLGDADHNKYEFLPGLDEDGGIAIDANMTDIKLARLENTLNLTSFDWRPSPDSEAKDPPPVGMEVHIWVEAQDGNPDATGPVKSRAIAALVVTDDEKRKELANRATDSITAVNETASDQERLNRELGEIIRARLVIPTPENE